MSEPSPSGRVSEALDRLGPRSDDDGAGAPPPPPADPGSAFKRALERLPQRERRTPDSGNGGSRPQSAPARGSSPTKLREPGDLGGYRAGDFVSRLFSRATRVAQPVASPTPKPRTPAAPVAPATPRAPAVEAPVAAAPTKTPAAPPAAPAPPTRKPTSRKPVTRKAAAPTSTPPRAADPPLPLGKQPTAKVDKPKRASPEAGKPSRPFRQKTRIVTPGARAGTRRAATPSVPKLKPSRRLPTAGAAKGTSAPASPPSKPRQDTTRRETVAEPPPPRPQSPQAAPVAGETTNEFEALLEGMLTRRDEGAASPAPPAAPPSSPPPADPEPPARDAAFSADSSIFPSGAGNESNLSDFVGKILDELDDMVGDGSAPERPRDERPTDTIEPESVATASAPPPSAGSGEPTERRAGRDSGVSKLSQNDLSTLESLFDDED